MTVPRSPASRDGFGLLTTCLPSGRSAPAIPKAANALVDAALSMGWMTLVQWGEDSGGAPFLGVDIARVRPLHHFKLCWHTRCQHDYEDRPFQRDVSTLRMRLFNGTYRNGGPWVDAPSLKVIRQLIHRHPATT